MALATTTLELPVLGSVTLEASESGLRRVTVGEADETSSSAPGPAAQLVERAARELEEYVAGRRREFTVPLDLKGTDFQQAVWRSLVAVPYGETRSYADIAREVGRPTAARAVGAAVGANPLCVVVPCHRIVGSNGSLTGFAHGLEMKRRLLEIEGMIGG